MGDVLKFNKLKARKAGNRTMCANNHHKWKIMVERKFDTVRGKLVTQYQCERCGKMKTVLL